jgi:hypothetical protein
MQDHTQTKLVGYGKKPLSKMVNQYITFTNDIKKKDYLKIFQSGDTYSLIAGKLSGQKKEHQSHPANK